MSTAWMRVVEGALRLAAVLSLILAVLWIVGANGLGRVYLADVPGPARELALSSSTLFDWSQHPRSGARFTDREDWDALYAVTLELGSIESGVAPDGYADVTLSTGPSSKTPTWCSQPRGLR